MKALVIDDAPDIRLYVRSLLEAWGYESDAASDGLDGFARIKASDVRLVICDWAMPGMSGPEVCRAVREAELGHYVYFILLTGRSDKADLVEGLNSGADDFLSKPFDAQVLRARIRVAERLLGLEQKLAEQNRELTESRNRLARAYEAIQTDLAAAARIQRQLLPTSDGVVAPWHAEWLFLPAAQISGDGFNFFALTDELVGFYHLDVSGHGIPAALLSASLSRSLVPGGGPGAAAHADFLDPARFLADLNRQLVDPNADVENFATVAYGTLNKRTGAVQLALAGHPRPLIWRRSGEIEHAGTGGLPVGLFPEVDYRPQQLHLDPGDRLVLYSDGVTDCENRDGEAFGEGQLLAIAQSGTLPSSGSLTETLGARLQAWRGSPDFQDDISVLVLERPAPAAGLSAEMPATSRFPPPRPAPRPGLDRGAGDAMTTARAEACLLSSPADIAGLQPTITTLCRDAGLDELAAFQLTSAVVEAVNNCIEHAYAGETGCPIVVTWRRAPDAIIIEIRDHGRPLPPSLLEPGEPPPGEAEAGRGWHIIRNWTDTATYSREADQNVLTLTRRL